MSGYTTQQYGAYSPDRRRKYSQTTKQNIIQYANQLFEHLSIWVLKSSLYLSYLRPIKAQCILYWI